MSPYFETIQLLNGELKNLDFHQERFERTRSKALGLKRHPLLGEAVQVPRGLEQGVLKCRVIYEKEIVRIEYEPHRAHNVHSLKIVYSDSIEYGFKYTDRSELEILFNQRENCDDILIVKRGNITDSFYANIVFWDGNRWYTPNTPLLPGTMRASLITAGAVTEEHITSDDLKRFQKAKLINAMNNLQIGPEIPIESILF